MLSSVWAISISSKKEEPDIALRWGNYSATDIPAWQDGVSNFTALAAARHAVLEREGWNVEADGDAN